METIKSTIFFSRSNKTTQLATNESFTKIDIVQDLKLLHRE